MLHTFVISTPIYQKINITSRTLFLCITDILNTFHRSGTIVGVGNKEGNKKDFINLVRKIDI